MRVLFAGVAIAAMAVVAACSKPPQDPLTLEGNLLTVDNRSSREWTNVEIWLNTHYRVNKVPCERIEHGQAEIRSRSDVPVLPGDARVRHESRSHRVAQGTGPRQQAGADRSAADSRGGSRAARGDLSAVGRSREDPRRCAVQAVRRSAASGARRAGHPTGARFRYRLDTNVTQPS